MNKNDLLTTEQIFRRYGDPLDWSYLVDAHIPYSMSFSWHPSYIINRFKCHRLIKDNVEAAFLCLLDHYGIDQIKELGLDIWGGCHEDRRMRGGNKWSRHAWGIAIDLKPKGNGLRTRYEMSDFSRPEYKALHEIMEEHNFINYGKVKGYDSMHFEIRE